MALAILAGRLESNSDRNRERARDREAALRARRDLRSSVRNVKHNGEPSFAEVFASAVADYS